MILSIQFIPFAYLTPTLNIVSSIYEFPTFPTLMDQAHKYTNVI